MCFFPARHGFQVASPGVIGHRTPIQILQINFFVGNCTQYQTVFRTSVRVAQLVAPAIKTANLTHKLVFLGTIFKQKRAHRL